MDDQSASMTFSAAFNALFLVYTALFSASFFAVVLALTSLDASPLAQRVQPGFPHRGLAIFLFVAGFGTLLVWTSELLTPLLAGPRPKSLDPTRRCSHMGLTWRSSSRRQS
jgi:hypothetical protein